MRRQAILFQLHAVHSRDERNIETIAEEESGSR